MSFYHTRRQFEERIKDETRRVGWKDLKPGKYFTAVEKSQGLRKGEHVVVLGQCQCISNKPERLDEIIKRPVRIDQPVPFQFKTEVEREGFPQWKDEPKRFVEMFCEKMSTHYVIVTPQTIINRIVFKRMD